jgi:hypothetical protein
MLYDTILVIFLALSTIIILHIAMTQYLHLGADESVETFIRGLSRSFRHQRPIIIPVNTQGSTLSSHVSHTLAEAHPLSHTVLSKQPPLHANDVSDHSLESELKQWMQQEAMNWSAPVDTTSTPNNTPHTPHTHKMSTSIDKLFADQQVQIKDVQLPKTLDDTRPAPQTKPTEETPATKYSNTMNSGDLGNGLSAFDTLDSSFATF